MGGNCCPVTITGRAVSAKATRLRAKLLMPALSLLQDERDSIQARLRTSRSIAPVHARKLSSSHRVDHTKANTSEADRVSARLPE